MTAPFRIGRPDIGARAVARGRGDDFNLYLDRLMKMIPGEVVGLYLVGSGFIPKDQRIILMVWSVICLFGVVAIKAYGTADSQRRLDPDWTHVLISSVAFVIWLYILGGPFAAFGLAVPYVGSLLVLGWTFFVPLFYKGPST